MFIDFYYSVLTYKIPLTLCFLTVKGEVTILGTKEIKKDNSMLLKQRFNQLVLSYKNDSVLSDQLWIQIERHYTEAHRTYHNLQHIEALFLHFDKHKTHLENFQLVAFAIFYHDIIYNIGKNDNEEKSAELALEQLKSLDLKSNELAAIQQLILATKTHQADTKDEKWLIDFDLSILGQSPFIYQEYVQNIRQEYKVIPDPAYKSGRKKVLQHFLNKNSIFSTKIFQDIYEQQARQNLSKELKILEK